MNDFTLDQFDHAILNALISDSTATNAQLSEIAKLSASQCSRRRTRLEEAGIITGYGARVNEEALGFTLRAITRINLTTHGEDTAQKFASFVKRHEEIESAYSVSGDADYVLLLRTRDLKAFADFIHTHLLPQVNIAQVRSEIVLTTIKTPN
ncbi:MAG: Lrp/AsnC family transcriptional regulator [Salaquimonas sp.]